MKRRTIVVDTNVLIRRPQLFLEEEFSDTDFILMTYVIGEMDKHKSRDGEVGYGARLFSRTMIEILKSEDGKVNNLAKGITTSTGSTIKSYEPNFITSKIINILASGSTYVDDLVVVATKLFFKGALMFTQDTNMIIKSSSRNITPMISQKSTLNLLSDLYKGRTDVELTDGLDIAYVTKGDTVPLLKKFEEDNGRKPYPNEYITSKLGSTNFVGRYDVAKDKILEITKQRNMYGFKPKNVEQKMVFDALSNPKIKLVTITGIQGTGKTFLALASALEQAVNNQDYDKILIGKNTAPLDKHNYQGFTTGSTEEKLLSHFSSYLSNLENLHAKGENFEKDGEKHNTNNGMKHYQTLNKMGKLEILDISSIMGSSFNNKIIIIDEAQSFDVQAMKSILTRVGEGTKIIVVGDVLQGTVANLTGNQSGLFSAVDWLKEIDETAHITLKKCERSTIVSKIAKVFDEKMYG